MAVLPLASVELEHLKFERSLTDSSQLARLPWLQMHPNSGSQMFILGVETLSTSWGMRVGNHSALCLHFGIVNRPKKNWKISTVHSGIPEKVLWADKTCTTRWAGGTAAAEFKFESKLEPLQVIWQSLPKAIPEDNRSFWLENQWSSCVGSAPAQLRLVRWARTNTESFPVGSSRC